MIIYFVSSGITCILPKLLLNGQIFPLGNVYFCGTHVRFRCYHGYRLVGVPTTYCSENGTWTKSFPSCECELFLDLLQ